MWTCRYARYLKQTVADLAMWITQSRAKTAEPVDLECILAELEALTDEQARRHLAGATNPHVLREAT
jgi:hypothetical protein